MKFSNVCGTLLGEFNLEPLRIVDIKLNVKTWLTEFRNISSDTTYMSS